MNDEVKKISSVYFIGIGGIGMSAIARFFHSKGIRVSGYDRTETVLTEELEAEGIDVHLTPLQLKSVLLHEIGHVRRRDNLTGLIHSAVEESIIRLSFRDR